MSINYRQTFLELPALISISVSAYVKVLVRSLLFLQKVARLELFLNKNGSDLVSMSSIV